MGAPKKTCLGSLKTLKYVSGCVLIPGGQKKSFAKKKQRSNKKQSNTLHKFFFSHGVKI